MYIYTYITLNLCLYIPLSKHTYLHNKMHIFENINVNNVPQHGRGVRHHIQKRIEVG
jgi:hypothetical protein